VFAQGKEFTLENLKSSRSGVFAWNCVSCGGPRSAGTLCSYCGNLYPQVGAAVDGESHSRTSVQSESLSYDSKPLNSKYKISRLKYGVEISWKWRTADLMFFIVFAAFWNGIFFSISLERGFEIFFTLHLLAGLYMVVYIVAQLLNTTSIRVSQRFLQIRHDPIPVGKYFLFPVKEIRHLYVHQGIAEFVDRTSLQLCMYITT